jgi:transcriptional regulator with XRE-family HTH domain
MFVDYSLIGQRIKEQRVKRKMTQEELAERANVTSGYISLVETARKKISLETLLEVCIALNITLNELLTGNQIPLASDYNADYAEIIESCNEYERKLIYEITKATSEVIINNRKYISVTEEMNEGGG